MQKVAFLFPGQGSQSTGMGKDFYENFAVAREMVEAASDRLKIDMKGLLFEPNEMLEQTAYTQPAILLVSAIAQRIFSEAMEIKPVFALGHSLGEISALAGVGAIDPVDAVYAVHKRGEWMQQACEGKDAGMMVVLGLEDAKAEEICQQARQNGKQVWAANYNGDGQIVLAGAKADLNDLAETLKSAGAKRAMLLAMSVASHCPILASAVEPLRELLGEMVRESFIAPVISNVTTQGYATRAETIDLLGQQLVSPVRYKQSIRAVAPEADLMIEFGNGAVLAGLNKKLTDVVTLSVNDAASLEKAYEALRA